MSDEIQIPALFLCVFALNQNQLPAQGISRKLKTHKIMKKLLCLLAGVILLSGSGFAQNYAKSAKKQAKEKAKDGWVVNSGVKPLEMQYEKSYKMDDELTEDGKKKYIAASGMATGTTYSGARLQAIATAKTEMAGNLESNIAGLISASVGNEDLGQDEAESVSSALSESEQMIAKSLGRVEVVVECYRQLSNKNYQVEVRLYYDLVQAEKEAKKAVRDELKKRGAKLSEKLNKLLE